jgi:hypothetical protein
MPPKDGKPSIVAQLPIVFIANIVQRVSGYHQFTRDICPVIKPSRIHSFRVDQVAVYEMMASTSVDGNFTIMNNNGKAITSAVWATRDKMSTFGAFFDLPYIQSHCNSYGIEWQHSFVYHPEGTVNLVGQLKSTVHASMSYHEQRQQMSRAAKQPKGSTMTKQKRKSIDSASSQISSLSSTLKQQMAALSSKKDEVMQTKAQRKTTILLQERSELYLKLKDLKCQRNTLQMQVFETKRQLKEARSHKYVLIKSKVNIDA